MHRFVYEQDVGFPGFGFGDANGVAYPFSGKVFDSEFEQVSGADSVIDAKGEQQKVSGLGGQQLFDGADVVGVSDGFNRNFAAFGRVVRVGHVEGSFKVKFLHDYSIILNICRELKVADA